MTAMKQTHTSLQTALLLSFFFSLSLLGGCKSGRTIIDCGGAGAFTCPPGLYCALGEECGGIDRIGTCRYQPEDCSNEEETVCGCDGNEYRNTCFANSKGISIRYPGPCITSTAPRTVDIPTSAPGK